MATSAGDFCVFGNSLWQVSIARNEITQTNRGAVKLLDFLLVFSASIGAILRR